MQLDPVSMTHQSEAIHNQQHIVRGTSHDSGKLQSENSEAVNTRRDNKVSYTKIQVTWKDNCKHTAYKVAEKAR